MRRLAVIRPRALAMSLLAIDGLGYGLRGFRERVSGLGYGLRGNRQRIGGGGGGSLRP
jgi:hypothetical protein